MVGSCIFTDSSAVADGFAVSFAATGDCTVSGTTVHLTGPGSCTITASQPGDSFYASAPDVEAQTSAVREVLTSEDAAEINSRTEALQTSFHRVSEAMYQRAQEEASAGATASDGAATDGASTNGAAAEEDVVDAEVVDEGK